LLKKIPFSSDAEDAIRWLSGALISLAVIHGLIGLIYITCGTCGGLWGSWLMFSADPILGVVMTTIVLIGFVIGLILLFQAFVLLGARTQFALVLQTDDDDQTYLVKGLAKLRTFFIVEIIFLLLAIASSALTAVQSALQLGSHLI